MRGKAFKLELVDYGNESVNEEDEEYCRGLREYLF